MSKSIEELQQELAYLKAINSEQEKIDARNRKSKMPSDGNQHSMNLTGRNRSNEQFRADFIEGRKNDGHELMQGRTYSEIMEGLVRGDYKRKNKSKQL